MLSGVAQGARTGLHACPEQPEIVEAPLASATIWTSGCTRNPYFLMLGASLLFDNRFLMLLLYCGCGGLNFHPFSPFNTHIDDILAFCMEQYFHPGAEHAINKHWEVVPIAEMALGTC